MTGPAVAERFWTKVDRSGECWLWTAHTTRRGYGTFGPGGSGRSIKAHRWAYEALIGPVPDGLELDHLCRNRACVNPAHLEPVTHAENVRRSLPFRPRPAHCPHGHEYTEANVLPKPGNRRGCRECNRLYLQRRRSR